MHFDYEYKFYFDPNGVSLVRCVVQCTSIAGSSRAHDDY